MISYNRTPVFPLVLGLVLSLIAIGLVTKSEGQTNQPLVALVCLLVAIVAFAFAVIIKRQPAAMILSPEGVVVREKLFGSSQFLTWEEVTEVHYVIEARYSYYTYFPRREVRFLGERKRHLASLCLDRIAEVDFNDIHEYVGEVAPHIVWNFPA